MSDCDDLLTALLLGAPDDEAVAAHLRACTRCREDAPLLARLSRTLGADVPGGPSPELTARALALAGPLLSRNAARATRRRVVRALVAALVPLPAILALDLAVVRLVYDLLGALLPRALTLYVVFSYASLLALLLALTYGAVPILAVRQGRLALREGHA
jgi:hypothetical protein